MNDRYRLLIFFTILLQACGSDPLDVDVSGVDVDISFERFEEKLFSADNFEEMKEVNLELIQSGQELYEFYVYEMLHAGSVYDDSIATYLLYFVKDSMMKTVMRDIEIEFGDFQEEQDRIIDIFKHIKYYMPEAPLPENIITYNSAFNFGVVSTDSRIGLGLEMYLGIDNPIIQRLGFPVYMKEKMSSEYLPVDVAHSWLITNVMGEDKGETFLSSMIFYGKLRYILKSLMPDIPDETIIRYTKEEYDWCLASEYNVWQYLMDMNWIYSTDIKVKMRFFEESPETVGIEGSPGRMGQFIGWQMVKQYMENNPEVTVEELMNEMNEAKILKEYKPNEI